MSGGRGRVGNGGSSSIDTSRGTGAEGSGASASTGQPKAKPKKTPKAGPARGGRRTAGRRLLIGFILIDFK